MPADCEGLIRVQAAWRAFIQDLDRPPEPKYGPGLSRTTYTPRDPTPGCDPLMLDDGTLAVAAADETYVAVLRDRLNAAGRDLLDKHFGKGVVHQFACVSTSRGLRILAGEVARLGVQIG